MHASTQRVAERATTRARASGHRRDSSKRTLHGTTSRNQNTTGNRGARGARSSRHVPNKDVGNRKEALRTGRDGDSKARADTTHVLPFRYGAVYLGKPLKRDTVQSGTLTIYLSIFTECTVWFTLFICFFLVLLFSRT